MKWIKINPTIPSAISTMLDTCDSKLIMCLFDNGDVLRYDEEHPFALLTHVLFLPDPKK